MKNFLHFLYFFYFIVYICEDLYIHTQRLCLIRFYISPLEKAIMLLGYLASPLTCGAYVEVTLRMATEE